MYSNESFTPKSIIYQSLFLLLCGFIDNLMDQDHHHHHQSSSSLLVQRYRHDRRKLIDFLLSSGLVTELKTLTTTNRADTVSSLTDDIDFDHLSIDYILQCLQSGGVVDVSKAMEKYRAESTYPVTIQSQSRNSYFLLSDPDTSGSPPRRVPPPIKVNQASKNTSTSFNQKGHSIVENGREFGFANQVSTSSPKMPIVELEIPSLGLPNLKTGLSDDDLRESAYELLLASMFSSGVGVHSAEARRKEKNAKLFSGLKNKRDKISQPSQSSERHAQLIDTVRIQMQISEAMDACTRRSLLPIISRIQGHIDLPQISLGLLSGVFRSDFPNEKSYVQWKCRQANILEELLCSANLVPNEHLTIKSCLRKIRDTKEWDVSMSVTERAEVLSLIRQAALKLSSLPGKFGIRDGSCYWTDGYALNIRLYEKLLFGMFDVLDEDQLVEEADEVLRLIKLTCSALGVTAKMHNAMYGWTLFQQFARTDEVMLLESAIMELQKVLTAVDDDEIEGQYINSLVCSRETNGSQVGLSMMQSIFLSISIWCDSRLQDYHLHFSQKPNNFRKVMNLASAVGIHFYGNNGETKTIKLKAGDKISAKTVRKYVERSTKAACKRVANTVHHREPKVKGTHPLALLANELRLIAQFDLNVFCPVLCDWCPESMMISAMLLHQFFGERLNPFVDGITSLSEDVRYVLPAASMLDHELTLLYNSSSKADRLHHPFNQGLNHYKIGDVCKPIIIDWVIAQHGQIIEWTGRAFDIEDWQPLSLQQKQGASIVEIFRILEETVDQFFGLKLPLDITHLQALLSVIFHSLDAYLFKVLDQLVVKNHLYPLPPPLTRYTEATMAIVKKKLIEQKFLDENVSNKLNQLTTRRLCVMLNTLEFIHRQIGMLEDGIRKSWTSCNQRCAKEESPETSESDQMTCGETVDELFANTCNIIRDTAKDAITKISDFIGARVVFWDLRDIFLSQLYRGSVSSTRLDTYLPHIDNVLDTICNLIDDTIRDLVVLSVCRASLEGYAWVLLDGGPSRAFSDSDIRMMEDDLNNLKEFFIAEGEGLPRSIVDKEAKFAERILDLFSLESEDVIQMLMTASEHISMGLNSDSLGHSHLPDAQTLMRVLCHKKDREASKFLKRQYELPMSSDYDDTPTSDPTAKLPFMSDILSRSASFRWDKKSHKSYNSFKKKLQEATNEIRNVAW